MASTTASAGALLDQLIALPAQPGVVAEVAALAGSANVPGARLGRLIEADPALTIRLLRLANSAFFGRSRRVGAVSAAIMVVGFDRVRHLAADAAQRGAADGAALADVPAGGGAHALRAAVGAALVAHRVAVGRDSAFTAGLLHDVGIALLAGLDPTAYRRLVDAGPVDPRAHLVAERATFGLDHAQAGGMALDACGFPPDIVEAVRTHHRRDGERSALCRAVIAGDVLAGTLVGTPAFEQEADAPLVLLDAAGIRAEEVGRLRAALAKELRAIGPAAHALAGDPALDGDAPPPT